MATYTKETALYDTAAIAGDIQEAGTTASKYIAADSTGIMVYDGTSGAQTPSAVSDGTNNVFIDDDSVDVRTGSNVRASFGAITTIGPEDSAHAEIQDDSFVIYNGVPTECFLIDASLAEVATTKSVSYVASVATYPNTNTYGGKTKTFSDLKDVADSIGLVAKHNSFTSGGVQLAENGSTKSATFSFYNPHTRQYELKIKASISWNKSTGVLSITLPSDYIISGTRKGPIYFNTKKYIVNGTRPAPALLYGSLNSNGSIGAYSSAMGYAVNSSGNYSHAEGSGTTASGHYSHAEGRYTTASGTHSHAQNNYTIAARKSQTAIGEYNVEETGDATTRGSYSLIIGNGTSTSARSNALTVDWSGNVNIASGAKYKINGTALAASDVGAVPTTRTVNSKALSANISLTASDVGAVPTTRKVNSKALSADISLAASDVGAVPTTRTVNSKALSADISLTASDVGAVPTTRTVNGHALSADVADADYVTEQGTSSSWNYRKWKSGKIEAWRIYEFASASWTVWTSPIRYMDKTISIPSGIFSAAPSIMATSASTQYWVVGCTASSATAGSLRLATVASSAMATTVRLYAHTV